MVKVTMNDFVGSEWEMGLFPNASQRRGWDLRGCVGGTSVGVWDTCGSAKKSRVDKSQNTLTLLYWMYRVVFVLSCTLRVPFLLTDLVQSTILVPFLSTQRLSKLDIHSFPKVVSDSIGDAPPTPDPLSQRYMFFHVRISILYGFNG